MCYILMGRIGFYGSDDDFCVHDGSEKGATAGVRVSEILDFLSIGILGLWAMMPMLSVGFLSGFMHIC